MGLPTILLAVGTAVNTVGSLAGGAAKADNLNYQAQVADYNANIATQQGAVDVANQGLKNRARVASIKAGQAGAGVDVNTGSAADIQAAQAQLGELDALTIRSNAARKAFGYKTEQTLLQSEASQAKTASYFDAASSLIGGASSTYGAYSKWQLNQPAQATGVGTDVGYDSSPGFRSFDYKMWT